MLNFTVCDLEIKNNSNFISKSMVLVKILGRKILLDSCNESEVYNNEYYIALTTEEKIKFNYSELTELADAESKFGNEFIKSILKSLPNINKTEPIPSIVVYKNSDGLPIYIKQHEDYFLILGIGEFQYGRYKIILESVLKNTN